MATYKVPQDVEAEDKLIGPFSFRQFIYLLIAVGAGAATFFLFMAPFPLPLLTVVTLPIFALFAVIALPLRKDQPMELYVLAMVRFFLKPKRRIWNPDGTTTSVIIEVPLSQEASRSKDLSQEEAANRLSYLASIVDTHGWAAKGVSVPQDTSVYSSVANETYEADDMLDTDSETARSFDDLLSRQQQESRDTLMTQMQQQLNTPQPVSTPAPVVAVSSTYDDILAAAQQAAASAPLPEPSLQFNPYPSHMHQKTIDPRGQQHAKKMPATNAAEPVTPTVSPAIINLANNNDLSVAAIQHEAKRLADKEEGEEVVISLR